MWNANTIRQTALALDDLSPEDMDIINNGSPMIKIIYRSDERGGWNITAQAWAAFRNTDGKDISMFDIGDAITKRRFDGRDSLPTVKRITRKLISNVSDTDIPVSIIHAHLQKTDKIVEYAPGTFPKT